MLRVNAQLSCISFPAKTLTDSLWAAGSKKRSMNVTTRCGPNPRSALRSPSRRGKRLGPSSRRRADIIEFAQEYGRYGYRKIAALLRHAGWLVNDMRVERIWRRAGLKVPKKPPKRGRLWVADGAYVRLRPSIASCVVLSAAPAWTRAG
jgi:transposase InsO family protein